MGMVDFNYFEIKEHLTSQKCEICIFSTIDKIIELHNEGYNILCGKLGL